VTIASWRGLGLVLLPVGLLILSELLGTTRLLPALIDLVRPDHEITLEMADADTLVRIWATDAQDEPTLALSAALDTGAMHEPVVTVQGTPATRFRLPPGNYWLSAIREQQPVYQVFLTIPKGGSRVLRIPEVSPPPAKALPWGPAEATGGPDVWPQFGHHPRAWTSLTEDSQDEWLQLDFLDPLVPRGILVYETLNPGALYRVTVFTEENEEVEVWKGQDPTEVDRNNGVSEIVFQPLGFPTRQVKLYLASTKVPGRNAIDAVVLVDENGDRYFATGASASSFYVDSPGWHWAPHQATGAPNVWPASGDSVLAWSPRTEDGRAEWLLLDYAEPVRPAKLQVYQTFNPGVLVRVGVFREDGREVEAWSDRNPAPAGTVKGLAEISLAHLDFPTRRVKLYLDTARVPGWNQIDAVGLVDDQGKTRWATAATASSSYAELLGGPLPKRE
jgi:hypothetical protein